MKTTVDRLTDLVHRLRAAADPALLKQDAQALLATLDPEDLMIAEQQLVEAGLDPKDLRHLCSAHLELFGDTVQQLKQSLPAGHVIAVMIAEHDLLLGLLDELELLNQTIQQQNYLSDLELYGLIDIAQHLLDAEPHHQREEQVLFVAVEQQGLFGPPQVMRMEHEELRSRKRSLLELAQTGNQLDLPTFKTRLNTIANLLILTLRDHILKENNILYPAALQRITDAKLWQQMQQDCDRIGYCSFTPSVTVIGE